MFPDAVNRVRRSVFAFMVVSSCIGLPFTLAWKDHDTEISRRVSDGLISLAEFTAVSYIGGSSADYMMHRWSQRRFPGDPSPPGSAPDPVDTTKRRDPDEDEEPSK